MPATKSEGTRFHFDNVYNSAPLGAGAFYLYQIGDISCEGGYIGPVHRQICNEISYIASGSGEFICDNISYPVKRGDLFINRIGEEHYTKSSTYDPLRFFYVGFSFNDSPEITSHYSDVINLFQNRRMPVIQYRGYSVR